MILVPDKEEVFVHVPPRLNVPYLQPALSRWRGRQAAIAGCTMTNRCAHRWGGVRNSGTTVLSSMGTASEDSAIHAARVARSRRRRAEERMICAILHGTSLYGLLALAASSVVWVTQRARSRFVALQALQALMYQMTGFLLFLLTFCLVGIGFNIAAYSGLIARTGGDQPQLTSVLIVAGVLGFASIWFFRLVFPLWGVWAGVRVLRGRNFRYPILGRLAASRGNQGSVVVRREPEDRSTSGNASSGEPILAGLVHLSMLGGLAPILAPLLWATAKRRSEFLTHHLLQAALFQMLVLGMVFGWFFITWLALVFLAVIGGPLAAVLEPVSRMVDTPPFFFVETGMIVIPLLITGILAVVAAVRAFRGEDFRYPIVGKWLVNYLNAESSR